MKKLIIILALALIANPAFAMRQYYTTGPDAQPELTPPLSDYIFDYSLSASTSQAIVWPNGANYVNINCASPPYYVSNQSGITVPSGNVTDGTGAAMNPAQRKKGSETTFYIISTTAQECSFEFWGGQ